MPPTLVAAKFTPARVDDSIGKCHQASGKAPVCAPRGIAKCNSDAGTKTIKFVK